MRYIKTIILILALMMLTSMTVKAEDTKPAVTAPDAKQEVQEHKHEHGMGTEKKVAAVVDTDGVQRVEVTGGEYYYDPNYIVLKVNVPAELKVKKAEGYVPHDMVVRAPEAGIDFSVDLKKEAQSVKFTPTKVGKYPVYCDKSLLWFKSHRERGMEGIIEVVE